MILVERRLDLSVKFSEPVKMHDMCQEIANWLNAIPGVTSRPVTSMEIFEMSPTGELFPIFNLFYRMLSAPNYSGSPSAKFTFGPEDAFR